MCSMAEWCSSTSVASWFFIFSAFSRSDWIFSFSLTSLSTRSLTRGNREKKMVTNDTRHTLILLCLGVVMTCAHRRCLISALKLASAARWIPFLVTSSSLSRAVVRSLRLSFPSRSKFKVWKKKKPNIFSKISLRHTSLKLAATGGTVWYLQDLSAVLYPLLQPGIQDVFNWSETSAIIKSGEETHADGAGQGRWGGYPAPALIKGLRWGEKSSLTNQMNVTGATTKNNKKPLKVRCT